MFVSGPVGTSVTGDGALPDALGDELDRVVGDHRA